MEGQFPAHSGGGGEHSKAWRRSGLCRETLRAGQGGSEEAWGGGGAGTMDLYFLVKGIFLRNYDLGPVSGQRGEGKCELFTIRLGRGWGGEAGGGARSCKVRIIPFC